VMAMADLGTGQIERAQPGSCGQLLLLGVEHEAA
jgi:hypothetical protein